MTMPKTQQHHCTTPSPPSSSSLSSATLPSGDSPYVRAKRAQLVDKDPTKAVPLFWAAINNRDRVDSALKDMAVVMKQLNRTEEAIEAIRSFRGLCSVNAQDPIDNLLLDLYKKCGRMDDQIGLLNFKLKLVDEGIAFGGKATKLSRSQGKRFHVSLGKEKSRLLGNLAWAHMQTENYKEAEPLYRRALEIERDYNKQCNLAICLMKTGRLSEAKSLLDTVPKPTSKCNAEPYQKSYELAHEIMAKNNASVKVKKTWADMVEEEELFGETDVFADENVDSSNVVKSARRSLSFGTDQGYCSGSVSVKGKNRLQVFKDITSDFV